MDTMRRLFLAAGPAAAVFGSLNAAARAVPGSDPALAALAEYGRARASLDAAYARGSALLDKLDAARQALGIVTYEGVEVRSLHQLEALRRAELKGLGDDELERTIADLRRGNTAIRSAASQPDREYEAARAALIERGPALETIVVESQEAEAAEVAPLDVLNEAEMAVVSARPTTRAGAVAQLRFIADHFEELIDDSRRIAPDALRAAAGLLAAEAASA